MNSDEDFEDFAVLPNGHNHFVCNECESWQELIDRCNEEWKLIKKKFR
jgi:hypothetical protein